MALAFSVLAFREINISLPLFPTLQRGGDGPLGLKLGLDLRGGGHLVYQADTGTRIDVTFAENVIAADIVTLAQGLDIDSSVITRSNTSFLIETALLDKETRESLQSALGEEFDSLLTFQHTDITAPTADQMKGVLDTINRRVNLFGTEEPIIQQFGDDRIIVQLPGASGSIIRVTFIDPVEEVDLRAVLVQQELSGFAIDQSGDRTFKIKSDTLNQKRQNNLRDAMNRELGTMETFNIISGIDEAKALIGQTARLEFKERTCTDPTCTIFTDSDIGLTGDDLDGAFASTSPLEVGWVINIQFDSRGADIFSDLTQRLVLQQDVKRIAVFLDDEELLAPVARAWIRDGRSQISGSSFDPFTREEAQTLSIQLDAGRLPVPLKIVQESDVDALLGSESLRRSLAAGLIGLGLVMVFMVAYYRMAGVVAAVALVFYTLIVLSIFKLIPITLTLSHIGGFILSIGMAVDANVLIFERMKEEVRIGRTLASSMEVGFNRA
ncbi:MAG: protein translocase subunit SecD, partial [Chloroflexi bacterium]|nr:protein translocase subunit SecD [Chloroflexota bacterium]